MSYLQALPSYNNINNYVLYLLFKNLQIKTIKEYSCLIIEINNIFSKSVYIFEKNINAINPGQFCEHHKLKKVIIPNSVITISEKAFCFCSALTDVIIPNSVIYIKSFAFASCSSLKTINIPSSVMEIRSYCFGYCYQLEKINIFGSAAKLEYNTFYKREGVNFIPTYIYVSAIYDLN